MVEKLAAWLMALAVAASALAGTALPLPTEDRWTQPIPSPDGRFVAVTREAYRGVYRLDLETGELTVVDPDDGTGYRFAWAPDSSALAYRKAVNGGRLEIVVAGVDGRTQVATPLVSGLSLPTWRGPHLIVARFEGNEPRRLRLTGANDLPSAHPFTTPDGRLWFDDGDDRPLRRRDDDRVFFNPVVSPDGRQFVVECLDGNLYLGRLDRDAPLENLGLGSYPSFVRNGRALLIERTRDDGHQLTASDVFELDLATRQLRPLAADPARIERRPATDGDTLYYELDGRIEREPLR